ncbi:hypothetical protein SAMD00019534_093550 [Acytostelium subglobosum LB1]|uniref:hypothetical protein n=1 Tax=Acytostelium subglobosum LB1 TaxID=1410327 RepID=UPI000644EEBA|nr:hypothetical protein SAMD00019534_093550 [Acytostelium subglobosum LB1]GAM26180.1 hypothetical protein SAMD00019534_093550 [Acytostelium subglobosum LB1]|eukprot:XP_012750734.1 hypothetical protein SAMD00019534_093550 [Acytostelium subglobosum LB1]
MTSYLDGDTSTVDAGAASPSFLMIFILKFFFLCMMRAWINNPSFAALDNLGTGIVDVVDFFFDESDDDDDDLDEEDDDLDDDEDDLDEDDEDLDDDDDDLEEDDDEVDVVEVVVGADVDDDDEFDTEEFEAFNALFFDDLLIAAWTAAISSRCSLSFSSRSLLAAIIALLLAVTGLAGSLSSSSLYIPLPDPANGLAPPVLLFNGLGGLAACFFLKLGSVMIVVFKSSFGDCGVSGAVVVDVEVVDEVDVVIGTSDVVDAVVDDVVAGDGGAVVVEVDEVDGDVGIVFDVVRFGDNV